jgi:hypothetical protein
VKFVGVLVLRVMCCSQNRAHGKTEQGVSLEDQITFGSQIAQAMAFLESKRVVHGRLAAYVWLDVCLCQ